MQCTAFFSHFHYNVRAAGCPKYPFHSCHSPAATRPPSAAESYCKGTPSELTHVVKLSPQPQLPFEFGFLNTNSDLHDTAVLE